MIVEKQIGGIIYKIQSKGSVDVNLKTINSGDSVNEKNYFVITGRGQINESSVIATLTVKPKGLVDDEKQGVLAGDRSLFNESVLGLVESLYNSSLTLKLRKTERDIYNNIIGYTYDMVFIPKETTTKSTPIRYSINNKTRKAKGTPMMAHVQKIIYGSRDISPRGEDRVIKVEGDPGASYKIAVLKYTDYKGDDFEIKSSTLENIMIGEELREVDLGDGTIVKATKGIIPKSGVVEIKQNFPPVKEDTRYALYAQTTDKPGSELNKARERFFTQKGSGWISNPLGRLGWYEKTLYQDTRPTLTISATTTSNLYQINAQDIALISSYEGLSNVQVFKQVFNGKRNGPPSDRYSGTINVLYKLAVVNGANNLADNNGGGFPNGDPVFSNTGGNTSWTNSDFSLNGGTEVEIVSIDRDDSIPGDTGNDLMQISFKLLIRGFGNRSVTMNLNLDNHVTVS
jgi:hypothetical protein